MKSVIHSINNKLIGVAEGYSQMNNMAEIGKRAERFGAKKTLEAFTGLALSGRVVRIQPDSDETKDCRLSELLFGTDRRRPVHVRFRLD